MDLTVHAGEITYSPIFYNEAFTANMDEPFNLKFDKIGSLVQHAAMDCWNLGMLWLASLSYSEHNSPFKAIFSFFVEFLQIWQADFLTSWGRQTFHS